MNNNLFDYNRIVYNQKQLNIASSELATMDTNYPKAFSENKQLSVIQEPDIQYEETVYYLNVNSSDRDTINYPLQYDFALSLPKKYTNVKKVELISVIFPNTTNIIQEPYLVLDINEINTMEFTLQQNTHKGFSVCPLKNPNQGSGNGGFILTELGCSYHISTDYKVPKELSRLTVKVRDYTGALYTFGNSIGSGSTAKNQQISFILRITCVDACRKPLNLRKTY
jgi:hypothetical protein